MLDDMHTVLQACCFQRRSSTTCPSHYLEQVVSFVHLGYNMSLSLSRTYGVLCPSELLMLLYIYIHLYAYVCMHVCIYLDYIYYTYVICIDMVGICSYTCR